MKKGSGAKGLVGFKNFSKKLIVFVFICIFLLIIFGIYKENFIDKKTENIIAIINTVKGSTMISKIASVSKSPLSIYPEKILQGNPLFITIHASSTPAELMYDSKKISFIKYKDDYLGIIGIDFNEKNLKHTVSAKLSNGMQFSKSVAITPRERIEKPLGIPEKLGGNTKEAGKALISNLAKENAELATIKTENKSLWSRGFRAPLTSMLVTDEYGYNRNTAGQTIIHKGTDFRAATGTAVRAMNDGIVRIAKKYTVYGNTLVIDHGLGISTLYMHLSKINVVVGDSVTVGQVIGLSGDTGYVESAHLHMSIKINGISIDPAVFMKFFE